MYAWDEGIDHSWLGVDRDGHVALVWCCVGSRLPDWIRIPGVCLANLDGRIDAYLSDVLGPPVGGGVCSPEDRRGRIAAAGFYLLDFPCDDPAGRKEHFEYLAVPENPVREERLPGTFREAARFFELPGISFSERAPVRFSDWRSARDAAASPRLSFVANRIRVQTGAAGDGLSLVPDGVPRKMRGRVGVDFLENCRDDREPGHWRPFYLSWRRYVPFYLALLERAAKELGAERICLYRRGKTYGSLRAFRQDPPPVEDAWLAERVVFGSGRGDVIAVAAPDCPAVCGLANGVSLSFHAGKRGVKRLVRAIEAAVADFGIECTREEPVPESSVSFLGALPEALGLQDGIPRAAGKAARGIFRRLKETLRTAGRAPETKIALLFFLAALIYLCVLFLRGR